MHILIKASFEGSPGCSGQALLQLQSPLAAHAEVRAAGRPAAAVLFMRGNSIKLTAVNGARI